MTGGIVERISRTDEQRHGVLPRSPTVKRRILVILLLVVQAVLVIAFVVFAVRHVRHVQAPQGWQAPVVRAADQPRTYLLLLVACQGTGS
jgi:hypothetical protein